MSDYGDGTPPPPPPHGGGPQGGQPQYGQPYGNQPQEGQPYGTPAGSGDPYAQPPAYGAPPSDPYAQPPAYGAPPPPPGYGAPPPPYGAPPPPYGAPAPAYGAPPGAYGQPYGGYGAASAPGNLPSMGKRFAARLIDGVLYGVVAGIGQAIIVGSVLSDPLTVDPETGQLTGGTGFFTAMIGYILVVGLFGLLYEVVMVALKGATVGKMALGIKVVREADGQLPGWGPSVLRWIVPQASGWFTCGIGGLVVYLSPFWDNSGRQQGYHDKVAKTLVVNA